MTGKTAPPPSHCHLHSPSSSEEEFSLYSPGGRTRCVVCGVTTDWGTPEHTEHGYPTSSLFPHVLAFGRMFLTPGPTSTPSV